MIFMLESFVWIGCRKKSKTLTNELNPDHRLFLPGTFRLQSLFHCLVIFMTVYYLDVFAYKREKKPANFQNELKYDDRQEEFDLY